MRWMRWKVCDGEWEVHGHMEQRVVRVISQQRKGLKQHADLKTTVRVLPSAQGPHSLGDLSPHIVLEGPHRLTHLDTAQVLGGKGGGG